MFFKYVTLLAFAATAIAGAITPGVYRLTNVASQSTARSYDRIALVFVSSSKEDPGPYELVSSAFCLCFGINFNYLNYLPQTTVGY